MPPSKHITFEELSQFFHLPINQVAKELGVCATILKKICRRNRIPRWPHRKLKSLEKMVANLETNLAKNPADAQEIAQEIDTLRAKRKEILRKPDLLGKADFQVGLQRGQSLLAAHEFYEQQQHMQRHQMQQRQQMHTPRRVASVEEIDDSPDAGAALHSASLLLLSAAESYRSDFDCEPASPRAEQPPVDYCQLILSGGAKQPGGRSSFVPVAKQPNAIELPAPVSSPGFRRPAYRPMTFIAPSVLDFSMQLPSFRHPQPRPGSVSPAPLPALEPQLNSPLPSDYQPPVMALQF